MSLPAVTFRPPPLPEPAPIVRVVAAAETPWQPSFFRAPSLEVVRADNADTPAVPTPRGGGRPRRSGFRDQPIETPDRS